LTADASTPSEVWYESLPTVHAATGAILSDDSGRWLLVKSAYRGTWTVPGGVVEAGEAPHECVRREIREEVGIDTGPVRLVAVDWFPAGGGRRRDLAYYLFRVAGAVRRAHIRPLSAEVRDWTFADPRSVASMVDANLARCLAMVAAGGQATPVAYVPGGGAE
jgi:ADP-ribose pyrophosphatase YjhB (NUDIX family)